MLLKLGVPSLPYPFLPPFPSPFWGPTAKSSYRFGERCKFPSGSGRSPVGKRFLVNFEPKVTLLVT